MYALTAIEHIARNLPRAVANGDDLEARTRVAFGNTLSGVVMCLSATTSQHSMEHAMSAYHQDLPHGAGLIMLSRAYFSFFIDRHVCNERFVRMARAMGMEQAAQPGDFITALTRLQQACGVADLRMSDYGITPGELQQMTFNAFDTMPGLFESDRHRPVSYTHLPRNFPGPMGRQCPSCAIRKSNCNNVTNRSGSELRCV